MARTFAAIMALLPMHVVLLRAIRKTMPVRDGTITDRHWFRCFYIGLVGFVVGSIAQATVDRSVLDMLEAELAAAAPPRQPDSPPTDHLVLTTLSSTNTTRMESR